MSHKLMTYIYGANTVRVAVGGDKNAWFVLEDVCRELGIRADLDAVMAGLHGAERALVGYEEGCVQCAARCVSWAGLEALVARVGCAQKVMAFAVWARHTVLEDFNAAREAAYDSVQGRILERFRSALLRLGTTAERISAIHVDGEASASLERASLALEDILDEFSDIEEAMDDALEVRYVHD